MTDKEIKKKISDTLWDALTFHEMTQKQLSEESGVRLQTINSILYEKCLVRIDSLIAICRVLDISIDSMVGLYDE